MSDSQLFAYAIDDVIKNGEADGYFRLTADVITPTETIHAFNIIGVERIQNFETWSGDSIMIELIFPLGVYVKRIYPQRNSLSIQLTKERINFADYSSKDGVSIEGKYTAILKPGKNNTFEGSHASALDEESLNHNGFMTAEFQLFSPILQKLHGRNVSGILRSTTTKKTVNVTDALLGLISDACSKVKLPAPDTIKGISIVDVDNRREYESIIIPQDMILGKLATFLNRDKGVYSAGLGSYICNQVWWVYPLFNINRYEDDDRPRLHILKTSPNRMRNIERTYKDGGSVITVLATTTSNFKDDSGAAFIEKGNGFILSDATKFMDGVIKMAGGKALSNRADRNTEVTFSTKGSQAPVMRMSPDRISSNPFVDSARTALRSGAIATYIWENSNPSLLIPGMCVRMDYEENGTVYTKYGVLLNAATHVKPTTKNMSNTTFSSSSILSIFVDRSKHATS